jgi:hypothetical protein
MSSDVSVRPIVWVAASIATTVIVVVCGVFLLLHLWQTAPGENRVQMKETVEVGGVALQSAPQLDLARYRAEKQRLLDTAAWVDAQHGIARIPIADAMAMLAASAAAPASTPLAAGGTR